jgi:hypothetical protein
MGALVQWFIFLLAVLPLFTPIIITILNDQLYIVFFAGFMANWRYSYDPNGPSWTLCYVVGTVMLYTALLTNTTLQWVPGMLVDVVAVIIGIMWRNQWYDSQLWGINGSFAAQTSPVLVLIPTGVLIFAVAYYVREHGAKLLRVFHRGREYRRENFEQYVL